MICRQKRKQSKTFMIFQISMARRRLKSQLGENEIYATKRTEQKCLDTTRMTF